MRAISGLVLIGLASLAPARAEVVSSTDSAFVIVRSVTVAANAAAVWRELGRPAQWWQSSHTWSGNAANLSLDLRAGGCFCEALPQSKDTLARGSVEHMRVIHAAPGRMLRLSGALGPMQADSAHGTMTFTLTPTADGTTIRMEYLVSGLQTLKGGQLAPGVDGVLGAQLRGLAARFGASAPAKP